MKKQLIIFISVVCTLVLYTNYKAQQIFPSATLITGLGTALLFVLMLGWQFLYRSNSDIFNKLWFHGLAWTGSVLMGLWGIFILLSIPVDIIGFLISQLLQASQAATTIEQTQSISHNIDLSIFSISIGITVLGFLQVLRGPKVKQVSAAIPGLHPSLEGLKIAQISDLHVGPTIRKKYVEQVVSLTNALRPDLIVLTGDLADAKVSSIIEDLQPLGNLRSNYGNYYVTGNHEYYWGAGELIEQMKTLRFVPLINENRIVCKDEAKILVAGVTDPAGKHFLTGHYPDLAKAARSSEKTQLKILLAHRPDVCFEAEKMGFDLQFSGHTHSGQFFPFSLLIPLFHKYYRGLHLHSKTWLYVNPGTGYWGPANRFAVNAEITLLSLGKAH